MTDKEFCILYTEYYGEVVDNVKQIVYTSFTGEELKEYVEHCIKLSTGKGVECPKCDNPYPHRHRDNRCSCEECGNIWDLV